MPQQPPRRPLLLPNGALASSVACLLALVAPAFAGDLVSAPRAWSAIWDTSGTGLPINNEAGVTADRGLIAFKSVVANLGAPQEAVRIGDSGSIRFAAEPGTAIVSPASEPQAGFGNALALYGGTDGFPARLVVGAPLEDHGGLADAGAVYIFDRLKGLWIQRARIVAPDALAFANFGRAVAIDPDDPTTIVIGAPRVGGAGQAYQLTYTLQGSASLGALIPGEALSASAKFGFSVAVTQGVTAVGAPDDAVFRGRVHLFRTDTRASISEITGALGEGIGFGLDARDGYLVASAPYAATVPPAVTGGRVAIFDVGDTLATGLFVVVGELRSPVADGPGWYFGAEVDLHPKGLVVASIGAGESNVRVNDYRYTLGAPPSTAVPCAVRDIFAISSLNAPPSVASMGDVMLVGGSTPGLNAVFCRAFDMRVGGRDQSLDSVDDLLLVKSAPRRAQIWTLDGGARDAIYDLTDADAPGVPVEAPAGFVCLGSADFWGNGRYSTLWRNSNTRELWALQHIGPEFQCVTIPIVVPPALGGGGGVVTGKVLGIADTNGDRKTDLLALEPNGAVVEYAFHGPEVVSRRTLLNIAGHAVLGFGDFNGDGLGDVILRKLSNNRLRLLAIGVLGAELVDFRSEGPGPAIVFPPSLDVAATGDFTGDGTDDMVVYNSATRRLQIWSFEGTIRSARINVGGPLAPGWTVRAALDADGDFDPDLVLVKAATRRVAIWQMDGPVFSAVTLQTSYPAGWSVLNGVEQRR